MQIKQSETILYVKNQQISTEFYKHLLRKNPELNVPGMTEFNLSAHHKLGLMPLENIAVILGNKTPHPSLAENIPRCELYFLVESIYEHFENAMSCGAKLISPMLDRNWGHKVCYFSDPDGHIIAFAEEITKK